MTSALKTMHIDLRVGQSLRLGDAVVTLQEKSGRMARFTVRAPEAVQVRQQPGAQARYIVEIVVGIVTHGH